MTTTGKSRMSPRLSTSAPGWLLGWTFRRRNWFGIKVMNSALAALSLRDTGGIQKVRCQRLIMFAGLKPRRESLEFQKGWAAMAVLNLEWEWNIWCGGHIPGYPRTLHPLLPARAPISAEAAVDSSAHARTRLSLTSRTLHVSFPFPNATAVCLTLYTGATWKCKASVDTLPSVKTGASGSMLHPHPGKGHWRGGLCTLRRGPCHRNAL